MSDCFFREELPNTLLEKVKDKMHELEKVLNHYGYYMKETSGGSSHATFRKPNKTPITIPRHNPINKAYVILVKMVVESEDENEENA